MELSQSIFLKGSRFVQLNEGDEILTARSRTGHALNEFSIPLAVLQSSPARIQQRAMRLVPGVSFFAVLFLGAAVGFFLNSDESAKISCAITGALFFFATCAGLIRIRQASFDLLVFYNRFTSQPAFNLFYEKPNPTAFKDFVAYLVDRIKRCQMDISAKQEPSVPTQIEAFARLHKQGIITEDQFDDARRKLLETMTAESKRIGF